jgi:hypothetical protein
LYAAGASVLIHFVGLENSERGGRAEDPARQAVAAVEKKTRKNRHRTIDIRSPHCKSSFALLQLGIGIS